MVSTEEKKMKMIMNSDKDKGKEPTRTKEMGYKAVSWCWREGPLKEKMTHKSEIKKLRLQMGKEAFSEMPSLFRFVFPLLYSLFFLCLSPSMADKRSSSLHPTSEYSRMGELYCMSSYTIKTVL
jgi:hypothetical protein